MGRAPLSGTTHSPWLPLHAHPRAASQGWNLQDRVAGGLVSRIQAALGFGSSRRSGREACTTLQPSLDVLPSVTSGTNRFLPWGPWGRDLMGLLYPSNLHSLLPSSWPRGQRSPTQRAWPAGPKLPRKAADRWKLLGARPWRPPGIASTSVFETSPYLPGQSMLLVPVPTGPHPPRHLPADNDG